MKPRLVPRHGAPALIAMLVLIALSPGDARADIIPSGHRSVRTSATLDLGPFAGSAPRLHTVRTGETLQKIALQQLGDWSRTAQILALNPGLEPDRLKPGQRIVIPPAPGKDGKPTPVAYHFFSFRFTLPQFIRKQGSKRALPKPRRLFHGEAPWITKHGAVFVAVPDAKLGVWRKHLEAGLTRGRLEELGAKGVAASAAVKGVVGIVRDDDRVQRIHGTYTVEKIDGKRLVVTRKIERLDAEGKKIGMASRRWALLFASAAGLLALAAATLRRRRN